jgi:transposase
MADKIEEKKFICPKRWSAARKMEIVLRRIRGEPLDALSREIGVEASQIEEWYQRVIQGMELSLKDRERDPLQRDLDLAKKQIGELCMENELLKEKSKKQGVFYAGTW